MSIDTPGLSVSLIASQTSIASVRALSKRYRCTTHTAVHGCVGRAAGSRFVSLRYKYAASRSPVSRTHPWVGAAPKALDHVRSGWGG
eukprot:1137544-Prymnesium_polylepis.1